MDAMTKKLRAISENMWDAQFHSMMVMSKIQDLGWKVTHSGDANNVYVTHVSKGKYVFTPSQFVNWANNYVQHNRMPNEQQVEYIKELY